MGTSLSSAIAIFVRESRVYLAEAVPPSLRNVVADGVARAGRRCFETIAGRRAQAWPDTFASRDALARLRAAVCASEPRRSSRAAERCLKRPSRQAPVRLERRKLTSPRRRRSGSTPSSERFHAECKRRLLDACSARCRIEVAFPCPLRRAARDVLTRAVDRPDILQELDFVVRTGWKR